MSGSVFEHMPSDTVDGQLASDLLRDFYQSFRLAQSETAIQPPLFARLAYLHKAAGHAALLPAAILAADSTVDTMLPPAHHAATYVAARNHPETGFRAMWQAYSEVLLDPSQGVDRPDEYVLGDMLAIDQHYQDNPRPNRQGKGDPHESIVREYILRDKLKGSEQLLQVRTNLKGSLLHPSAEYGEHMSERFETVIASWEDNHPGQSFL